MKFKVPNGLVLKPYTNPEKAGYIGWLEDADGRVVGYLKSDDDEDFIPAADVEEAPEDDAPKPKPKGGKAPAAKKKPAEEPVAHPGLEPGRQVSLSEVNAFMRRQAERTEAELGDPRKRPFATRSEALKHTQEAAAEARRRIAAANKEAEQILGSARGEAVLILEEAKARAKAIREGAAAEIASD